MIDPTHDGRVFRFIAAKRGGRIGWCDEEGEKIFGRYFCHERGGSICWRAATIDEIAEAEAAGKKGAGGKPAKTKLDFLALVPMEGAIPKEALISKAQGNEIGEKRARGFLAELLAEKTLYEWRIPRPKTNPERQISRHDQVLV
jgi:hypothetical protein